MTTLTLVSKESRERSRVLRAGAFVAGALLLAALVVLVLGREHRLFESSVTYYAHLPDVAGLEVDAPVRLGGLSVGRVTDIRFPELAKDPRIAVELTVSEKYAEWIRADSTVRVGSRGILGDKTIEVSMGSPEVPAAEEGQSLNVGSGDDIASVLKSAGEVADNVLVMSRDLRRLVSTYSDPELTHEVAGSVGALHRILRQVESGEGALGTLIYDPQTGAQLTSLLAHASQTAQRLDGAIAQVEGILQEVRTGDGTAHELLYGQTGKQALANLGSAAGEVTKVLQAARTSKNSAVHELVYGDSKGLVADLGDTVAHLKNVAEKVDRGDGSLGAIINDPTVYEDLKTVLGNVKRNVILRALVRYSISNRGELEGVGNVKAPARTEDAEEATGGSGEPEDSK